MTSVQLSNGALITFKPFVTHKADKVITNEFNRDVKLIRDEFGAVTGQEIPAGNIGRGYEMGLPLLIDSPVITQVYLDDLSREDYGLLYKAVQELYLASSVKKEEGEKKGA